MLKTLLKLPFKIALYPLKLMLRAAGIGGRSQEQDARRPAGGTTGAAAPRYEAPPEPEIPNDLEVQARELVAALDGGETIVFVDVRESGELAASGKIDGALHIPLRDLPRRFSELDPTAHVVLYCAAGMRSFDAAMFLRDKGFGRSRSMIGGLPGWQASGGGVVPL